MMKNFIAFTFLFFCIPAQAQTYEPGRGILLPRQSTQNAPVQVVPNSNSPTVIQNGQITKPQGNNAAPLVINPRATTQQNGNASGAEAQKMTQAYAAHLYTSVCSQEYRESLAPKTEANLDMAKLWNDVQTSCKCMSGEILSAVPAAELADYVMYNYSAQNSAVQNKEQAAYQQSGQSSRVEAVVANVGLRKKCGFLK